MNPISSLPRVALAGEALIDMISVDQGAFTPYLGGAVYNLTRAISRQSVPVLYLNPLSVDDFGRELKAQLLADGVHLAHSDAVMEPTSLAIVRLKENGHPSYAFYRQGVADRCTSAQALIQACDRHPSLQVIATGALALDPQDRAIYLPWLVHQREAGKCIVVDANLRPSVMPDLQAYRDNVWAMIEVADVVKVSDEDLNYLGVPGSDAMAQAQFVLAKSTAQWIALTLGDQGGCLLSAQGDVFRYKEPREVKVADTVGAGDSFLAGLLVYWLSLTQDGLTLKDMLNQVKSQDMQAALEHAVSSATLCVQAQGCQPPSFAQVRSWLNQD